MLPIIEAPTAPQDVAPALCVVIPTYNRIDILPICLRKLEEQTFRDFEVVIVDDGSTDETAAFLKAYIASNKLRVRYVSQRNGGAGSARNRAVSMTRARLCVVIGDDILLSPTCLAVHAAFHTEHAEIAAVALGFTRWDENFQKVTPFMRWVEHPYQFDYAPLLNGEPANWRHFYTSNISLKTEILKRNPFDERFRKFLEDGELGFRLARREGIEITFLQDAFATHVHPTDFRTACRRAREIGHTSRLFDEVCPEASQPQPRIRRALHIFLARKPWFLRGLTWITEKLTQVKCPNPLLRPVLRLQGSAGRNSDR